MANDEIFRTTRLTLLRGASPAYLGGENVFLQRDVQGFAKGSQGRVVSVHPGRPGEHRYHLIIGDEKVWAFEADLRPTPPGPEPLASGPGGDLSITHRLQSMSLSQRMATLGVDETRRLGDLATTQRMHALTQEERMRELLKTNRIKTLGSATPATHAVDVKPADTQTPASAPSVPGISGSNT